MNKREIEGEGEREMTETEIEKRGKTGGGVGRFPCITQQLDCVTHVYSLCWWR